MLTGSDVPTLPQLNAYVRPLLADVWYDLGLQLLPDDVSKLDAIKYNNTSNSNRACTEMFSLWLQKHPSASWDSLISTIRGPGVEKHNVAHKIEQMLQPLTGNGLYFCRYIVTTIYVQTFEGCNFQGFCAIHEIFILAILLAKLWLTSIEEQDTCKQLRSYNIYTYKG